MHKDFDEFLKLLNCHKAKYVIVGGYSLSAYLIPRATKDLDILIERTDTNAQRIIDVFGEFGFTSHNLTPGDLLCPGILIQLGRAPVRIDILTSITGVEWCEIWANRKKGFFGKQRIPTHFIGLDQLIENKTATGRDQDILDAKKLKQLKKGGQAENLNPQ